MKYPKLPDGPSPEGESGIRALERIDAPYLTQRNTDSISYKQGQFRSVSVTKPGEPYFWDNYIDSSGGGVTILVDPENHVTRKPKFDRSPFGHTPAIFTTPYHAFVGDGYLLTYYRDNLNPFNVSANYWPSLVNIAAPTPRVASAGSTNKQSVDYFPEVSTSGLTQPLASMTPFPCGFQDATKRFVFGVSFLEGPSSTKQPKMYIGNTGTRSIASVTPPAYTGRDQTFFTPFCVGRGKLQYLGFVKETFDFFVPTVRHYKAKVDPFLAVSSDFGATWSQTPLADLLPFMALTNSDGSGVALDRDIYDNSQIDYMALFGMSAYVGSGKVFIFVPNGMSLELDHSDPRNNDYCPMLFVADVGSAGLTRLAWPADDWTTNRGGWTRFPGGTAPYQVGFRRMAQLHSAHFSFGTGCFYVPIIPQTSDAFATNTPNTVGWRIMYTRDFGVSWTISPTELPAAIANVGDTCPAGTILKPFIAGSSKGRLAFSGTHPTSGSFEIWTTDGDFLEWKKVYSLAGAAQSPDLVQGGDPLFDAAFYGVNYGNTVKPRSVFPAFPGVFDHL